MLRWCDIMVNPTTIQRLSTPWLTVAVFTINHNQQSAISTFYYYCSKRLLLRWILRRLEQT